MGIGKIMSKVATAFTKRTSDPFSKLSLKKATSAPGIKVDGLAIFDSNASNVENVVNIGLKPKIEPLKSKILKPRQQRFEHAVDLIGKRNPTDFVTKDEVAKEIERLLGEKHKIINIGAEDLFKCSKPQAEYLDQVNRDIIAATQLLKIMG